MKFEDLLPGDIILFKWNQELFHVAIFAPEADRTSDLIDATSNKGVARSTLEGLYLTLQRCTQTGNLFGLFSNVLEINVVRSKTLNGQCIADQAEFWRLQHVTYDVQSLANIVKATSTPTSEISIEEEEANIHQYWKYKRRRNDAMLENPMTPSFFAVICSFFLAPIWNLPLSFVSFFVGLIQYMTQKTENKAPEDGVNCAGFVLTVLAAVALQDEPFFDIQTCKKKLGSIAKINPSQYSLNSVMTEVFSDTQLFENKGILDPAILATKPFNRGVLYKEHAQDDEARRNLNFMR